MARLRIILVSFSVDRPLVIDLGHWLYPESTGRRKCAAQDCNPSQPLFPSSPRYTRRMESSTKTIHSGPADAAPRNWVDRHAPSVAKPYLRLMRADRPIGAWLLLIPCLWGLVLALAEGVARPSAAADYAGLFTIGAFVMRGAGCAYNDIIDRDFDAKVARTAMRPIPAGDISLKGTVLVTELSGSDSSAHFQLGEDAWVSLAPGVHPYQVGEAHYHLSSGIMAGHYLTTAIEANLERQ